MFDQETGMNLDKQKIEVYIDISLQVSQLLKAGTFKRHDGCAMGLVCKDRKIKYSCFLSGEELKKIVKYYEKKFPLKTTFVRVHCFMIYLCLEPFLKNIFRINLCKDFSPPVLTRELYSLFPELREYNVVWNGGRGNKSRADKYANKIRKYPEFANQRLTLEKIENWETPHKE